MLQGYVYQLKQIIKSTLRFKLQLFFMQLKNVYGINIWLTRFTFSHSC